MKHFTSRNVEPHGAVAGARFMICLKSELIYNPPDWMKRGLTETTTGYGARLNSGYSISYNFRLHRIYLSCYGNSGSAWFKVKDRKIFVDTPA